MLRVQCLITCLKGEKQMNTLVRYNTDNIEKFLNDIDKYSIGMDDWFN
jgi:hypothetical protein